MSDSPEIPKQPEYDARRAHDPAADRGDARSMPDSDGADPRTDAAAAAFAICFPALITWVYFIALAEAPPGLQQAAYALGKSLQFAFPVVFVAIFHRRRLVLGGPRKAGIPEGIAFGLAVFAAALLLYHAWLKPAGYFGPAAGAVRDKIAAFHVDRAWTYFVMGVFYSVVHSFLEEYYWRWFVFDELRRLLPVAAAIAISALGFTLHHVLVLAFYFGWLNFATWFFSLAVAIGGAFWAWLYHRSGSLYGPWLSHLLIDAAIFAVGYDMVKAWFAA